jgi:hypothetical protein
MKGPQTRTKWKRVAKVLSDKVISMMKDSAKGRKWLAGLEECQDGALLGICIAIDVESGALPGPLFAEILDKVDLSTSDARRAFARAIAKHPSAHNFVCAGFPAAPLKEDDCYVRVIELLEFIKFYLTPSHYLTLNPADVAKARKIYFGRKQANSLEDINAWWTGGNGRVWITSHKELDQLLEGHSDEEKGTIINDSLGLGKKRGGGKDGEPLFMIIKYPRNFSVGCCQPTTLDTSWTKPGGYYVSYVKQDSWGRTQSCTGTLQRCRERVHSGFKNLTSEYSALPIGRASKVDEDRSKLLLEAFCRLDLLTRKARKKRARRGSPRKPGAVSILKKEGRHDGSRKSKAKQHS